MSAYNHPLRRGRCILTALYKQAQEEGTNPEEEEGTDFSITLQEIKMGRYSEYVIVVEGIDRDELYEYPDVVAALKTLQARAQQKGLNVTGIQMGDDLMPRPLHGTAPPITEAPASRPGRRPLRPRPSQAGEPSLTEEERQTL